MSGPFWPSPAPVTFRRLYVDTAFGQVVPDPTHGLLTGEYESFVDSIILDTAFTGPTVMVDDKGRGL